MLSIRLYGLADPQRVLEERALGQGACVIGRGDDVDWRLPDPSRELSRRHCVIIVGPDRRAALLDLSANGVFVGADGARIAPREPWHIHPPQTVRIGQYILKIVDAVSSDSRGRSADPPSSTAQASHGARGLETGAHPVLERLPHDFEPLLAVFCAGAQLELSAFADDTPEALMMRLGEVYRQLVLNLTNLVGERTSERAAYRMERTTIRVAGANPIRWQGARRAGVDLLKTDQGGFLPGPAAVAASFADVERHMACAFAGSNSAIEAIFQALAPSQIEDAADNRLEPASAWRRYQRVYEQHRLETRDSPDGLVNRAFRDGYAERLKAFDRDDDAA
ncbi:MAG TPA: type VI secretion system-associated FHA domain protein [Caulobacteraceae bacterium]|nr:type VI secretion system-associated FHA domain protein [Caulobacteraceae bacterium]